MNEYTIEEKIKQIIKNGLSCEICKHHFDCDGYDIYNVNGLFILLLVGMIKKTG